MLVWGVTVGVAGCRRKARERASEDDPRIARYQNPTGSRYLDRIVLLRGFDRKEVPNLTLHVLEASSLKVLKRVEMALDSQVQLTRIGRCRYFKAEAPNSKPRVYRLDDDFQLSHALASAVPASCWGKAPRLEITKHGRRRRLTICEGVASRRLLLPDPPNLPPGSVSRAWGTALMLPFPT